MIRKSAVIVIGVVALLSAGLIWLMDDLLVARMLEAVIHKATQSEVKVSGLDIQPLEMEAGFKRLSIQDGAKPWRNLVETGPTHFDVRGMQLFAKKMVIKEMSVSNLVVGKIRPGQTLPSPEEQAAIEEKNAQEARRRIEEEEKAAKAEEAGAEQQDDSKLLDKLSSMMADLPVAKTTGKEEAPEAKKLLPSEMKSVKAYQKLSEEAPKKLGYWNERFNTTTLDKDLAAISADIKKVKLGGYNSPQEAQQALAQLNDLNKRIDQANQEYTDLTKGSSRDIGQIRADYAQAKVLMEQDQAEASRLIGGMTANPSEAGKMILGPAVMRQLKEVLGYLVVAKKFMTNEGNKTQKPPRREGRLVAFPVTSRIYPAFLVERMSLTGSVMNEMNEPTMTLDGKLTGLASNQDITGQPALLQLTASNKNTGVDYTVKGVFDHRADKNLDSIVIEGEGIKLADMVLSDGSDPAWPSRLSSQNAQAHIEMKLEEGRLNGEMVVTARRVSFVFQGEATNNRQKVLRSAFDDMQDVQMKAEIRGGLKDMKFILASNLGTKISEAMNKATGKMAKEAEAQARRQVEEQVAASRKAADSAIQAQQQQLEKRQKEMENRMAQTRGEVASAKGKVEQQMKKASQEAAEKALKNLLQR